MNRLPRMFDYLGGVIETVHEFELQETGEIYKRVQVASGRAGSPVKVIINWFVFLKGERFREVEGEERNIMERMYGLWIEKANAK